MTNRFTYRPTAQKPPKVCRKPPDKNPLPTRSVLPPLQGLATWAGNDGTADFEVIELYRYQIRTVDGAPPPDPITPAYVQYAWENTPEIVYDGYNNQDAETRIELTLTMQPGWATYSAAYVLFLPGDQEYHAYLDWQNFRATDPWDTGLTTALPTELSTGPLVRSLT